MKADKTPPIAYARLTGWLYLIIIVFGLFAELGVRGRLVVPLDPDATAANILGAAGWFRLGFVADSIMLLSDVAVAVLLYVLLKPVNQMASMAAAAFRLIQAAVLGFNLLLYYAAVLLLSGETCRAVFTPQELHSLALLFLEIHSHGYDLGLLFFGISSLIVGSLVRRSGYLPSMLGYGLIAAGMVYLAGSFIRFAGPGDVSIVQPAYVIPLVAELAFCSWLLVKGLRS